MLHEGDDVDEGQVAGGPLGPDDLAFGARLDGLSRVNVIVGRNNAGKTSVLEAVSACCQPLNADAWLALARRRGP